ncbi:tetratricopeptide repeat protein (plasmid) [Streptomyces sp. NBC_00876]|uniref:tetratricopeptide repeat protein n=1 Tax=Streptomyces sp. NBC_00876 TaxID=2975853 RepID=UPI0038652A32|nr:tetratricopeptide repeat protein [Streptomyces sp. NBC_00876]
MRTRTGAGAALAGLGAFVAVVLGTVAERVGEVAPDWADRPWVVWTVFGVLTVLSAGLATASRRLDDPAEDGSGPVSGTRPGSLHPPHIVLDRVRGRDRELARLKALLKKPDGRFAVVCAAGGMGKTTLAAALAEYARRNGYAVFWIRWRGPESLADDFVQAAVACGLPRSAVSAAQSGSDNLPDAVWRQLAGTKKWLLVVDNADEAEHISPEGERVADYRSWIRPYGRGLFLVTSRDTASATWGPAAELIRLEPLRAEAGGRVLLDSAPAGGTPAEAEALAARLGGLPLALQAAGRYVTGSTSRHRDFAAYQSALEEELTALVGADDPRPADPTVARSTVRRTWEVSLDQLDREGIPLARPLLRQLALFAEAPVPLGVITPELLTTAVGRPVGQAALDQALAGLERYGLLGVPAEPPQVPGTGPRAGGSVTLHPLVREITVLALTTDEPDRLHDYEQATVDALRGEVTTVRATGAAGWTAARLLAPHLSLLFNHPDLVPSEDACAALNTLADVLGDAGGYALQLSLRQAVLDHRVALLGDHHPDTFTARNHFANSLHCLGGYERSEAIHRQNLADRMQVLGPDHPDTITSRNNVGYVLQLRGQYAEAATLHAQVLADRTRLLGADHLLTLTSRDNLAKSFDQFGNHTEAATLHTQNVAECSRVLGPDHPLTLTGRDNLAATVSHLGDPARAAELHRAVFADRTRVLGPDHPHTLTSGNNLADALHRLGGHADAAEILEQTLADRVRVLGADHPDSLSTRSQLALCRSESGRRQQR